MSDRGVNVPNPYNRLSKEQVELIDKTSLELLQHPGILCYHEESVDLFEKTGAIIKKTKEGEHDAWWVSIPPGAVKEALETAPSKIFLGARNPENRVILDAENTRVYFGTGSETNYWLEVEPETYISRESKDERVFPVMKKKRGSLELLCQSAHLAEQFENLDFFIRNVNVQDDDISTENKDVNVFFASLNHLTKPVIGGVADIDQLKEVVKMAEIIAGGRDQLRKNPVVAFITSVIKSPLQVVAETSEKLIAIARLGLPVVISTSPQGGSTAPIDDVGMIAQVNAEALAGITINQLANPGAPVIYGAVPVRARMDDLHDMYGVPEFCHYTMACAQMARYYKVPCYSTAGVGDAKVPGIQATMEKMLTHTMVPLSAPGLIHYSFGLLDKTQTFCPEQALLDNHQIGMIKFLQRESSVNSDTVENVKKVVEEVMHSPYRMYARYARGMLRRGEIFSGFPFEGELEDQDQTLLLAHERIKEMGKTVQKHLPEETCRRIFDAVPGLLPRLNPYGEVK
ncbi:MAG: trimethylamine methyltransferase family protein [Dethiobacteria bacterium]